MRALPAILLLLVSSCRCGGDDPALARRSFTAPHFGFAIDYPATWRLRQTGDQVLLEPADAPPSAEAQLFVAVEVLTSLGAEGAPRSLAQVGDATLEVLRAEESFSIVLDEPASLHERTARHLIVAFHRGGRAYREELILLPHAQRYLGLYYVAPAARFDDHRAVFQELLMGLKLDIPQAR